MRVAGIVLCAVGVLGAIVSMVFPFDAPLVAFAGAGSGVLLAIVGGFLVLRSYLYEKARREAAIPAGGAYGRARVPGSARAHPGF